MTDIRYFTQSELKTWRECRRKWWLGTYRRLKLIPELERTSAAGLGTLVHNAMEALYSPGGDWRAALAAAEDHAQTLWGEDAEHPDEERLAAWAKQLDLATIMVEGYTEWLEEDGADEYLTLVEAEARVEVFFAQILGTDVWLLGKLDQLVEDAFDDTLGFLDFKTVGSVKEIPKRAPRDEQFLHYSLLMRLRDPKGRPPAGGIWRQLRKVKRTARSNPPFYAEHRYRFNRHQLDAYYRRVHFLITEILAATAQLDAGEDPLYIMPPTPTGDCDWKCEFKDVCPMFDNGDRVEDFINEWYREGNPLERYSEQETEIT